MSTPERIDESLSRSVFGSILFSANEGSMLCRHSSFKAEFRLFFLLYLLLPLSLLILLSMSETCRGETTIQYEVRFEGVQDKTLLEAFDSVSNSIAFKEKPPIALGLLERRAEDDIPRLLEALQSYGYYGAEIKLEIDEKREPVLVVFHVDAGPLYTLRSVTMELENEEPEARRRFPSVEALGLDIGAAVSPRAIIEARETLIKKMRQGGFALVKAAEPRVIVDHSTRDVLVTFIVDPGPPARFGETSFTGLESVEEGYLQGKLPWKKGDSFNADLLDELQKRLFETRLFSLIRITPAQEVTHEGLLPINVEVNERKHRTISLGASYFTDEGPGVKVGWEHRNLFKGGERLEFEAKASGIGYEGRASLRKPAFLRKDQSLILNLRLAQDDTEAYTSTYTEIGLVLEREPWKGLRFGAGPAFRVGKASQELGPFEVDQDFALFSFPGYVNWDTSDDLLNPTRGGRLSLQLTPFIDTQEAGGNGFLKGYGIYSRYLKVSERPSLTLAGRAALGFLAGADLRSVPADLRFYSGGGGSIRGYPFQTVGPLVDDDPLGGRSVVELGIELRSKITEKLGLVLFFDGGSAFEPAYPDFGEKMLFGTGIGGRYFTPIGPLRLDIAFPLEKREGIDDPFQIYVSIGQAF